MSLLDYFRCEKLSTVLRRSDCATRYAEAPTRPLARRGPCPGCLIGLAHEKGKEPLEAPRVEPPRVRGVAPPAKLSGPGPDEIRERERAENRKPFTQRQANVSTRVDEEER